MYSTKLFFFEVFFKIHVQIKSFQKKWSTTFFLSSKIKKTEELGLLLMNNQRYGRIKRKEKIRSFFSVKPNGKVSIFRRESLQHSLFFMDGNSVLFINESQCETFYEGQNRTTYCEKTENEYWKYQNIFQNKRNNEFMDCNLLFNINLAKFRDETDSLNSQKWLQFFSEVCNNKYKVSRKQKKSLPSFFVWFVFCLLQHLDGECSQVFAVRITLVYSSALFSQKVHVNLGLTFNKFDPFMHAKKGCYDYFGTFQSLIQKIGIAKISGIWKF